MRVYFTELVAFTFFYELVRIRRRFVLGVTVNSKTIDRICDLEFTRVGRTDQDCVFESVGVCDWYCGVLGELLDSWEYYKDVSDKVVCTDDIVGSGDAAWAETV